MIDEGDQASVSIRSGGSNRVNLIKVSTVRFINFPHACTPHSRLILGSLEPKLGPFLWSKPRQVSMT